MLGQRSEATYDPFAGPIVPEEQQQDRGGRRAAVEAFAMGDPA
jgi:hypothetical protein